MVSPLLLRALTKSIYNQKLDSTTPLHSAAQHHHSSHHLAEKATGTAAVEILTSDKIACGHLSLSDSGYTTNTCVCRLATATTTITTEFLLKHWL